jgi:hypothetical protein
MPPPIAGTSFSSLGSSETTASVVVNNDDTLHNKKLKNDEQVHEKNEIKLS